MQDALIAPSIGEAYREHFLIGAAVKAYVLRDERHRRMIRHQFTSLTAENEMKPERLLDREATLALGDPVCCVLHFDQADRILAFARESDIRVRFHTLVWHNQTPRWFFAEGWSDAPDYAHRGFQTFVNVVERWHPRYFIHGHVHTNYGTSIPRISQKGATTVVNAFERYILEV